MIVLRKRFDATIERYRDKMIQELRHAWGLGLYTRVTQDYLWFHLEVADMPFHYPGDASAEDKPEPTQDIREQIELIGDAVERERTLRIKADEKLHDRIDALIKRFQREGSTSS